LINALAVATVCFLPRASHILTFFEEWRRTGNHAYEMINVPEKGEKWTVLIDMERKFVMPSGSRS